MWPGRMERALAMLVLVLAAGCAGTPVVTADAAAALLRDDRFRTDAVPSAELQPQRIFDLTPAMRAYAEQHVMASSQGRDVQQRLLEALYTRSDLQLRYDAEHTRTAAQAFEARAGNCMSLVVMTAAFAKHLGLNVRFQNVRVNPTFGRNGDLTFAYGHVNLSIGRHVPASSQLLGQPGNHWLTIDFLPRQDLRGQRFDVIEESTLVSMFMNNMAAEALARGQLDAAYAWARAALQQDRNLGIAYNTLGVIYQRRGLLDDAEQVMRFALGLEPDNVAVLGNLAPLLVQRGRVDEAQAVQRRLARLQPDPPFAFLMRGQQAMREGNYRAARDWIERELERDPDNPEFHYWLALAHIGLGSHDAARREMALAFDHSRTSDDQNRYAAKLRQLKAAAVQ
ncbi:MAG: tetratricopeptide repeat protein [Burkholderiaceae bacterium]|nr:tetratricopeptide repeat protein [Aquabacterium sp.]NUP84561.1 tetratricopeptide repeat protein [Burkholderiaceae bacterium]